MAPLPPYLYEIQQDIEEIARGHGLKMFKQIYEILDYKQMSEVAAYGGFPTRYPHWRWGMEFERLSKSHIYGLSKIYELVINNDPCYGYLLEGNSLVEQKLVLSHVCGHNDFFKNNYYFSKTNRKMIDEMANHAIRVRRLMEQYGVEKVEAFIDVCLSLDNLIDPMSMFIRREARPVSEADAEAPVDPNEPMRLKTNASYMEPYINPPKLFEEAAEARREREASEEIPPPAKFPVEPLRDVLGFLFAHAPLETWQRDILEIIRREAYYFSPQGMTKIMNEGWAVYWHSHIMTHDVLQDSEIIDFADLNAGVLSGGFPFNPYKIGVELFRHIEERWNKGRFGKEWDECDDLETKRSWDRKLGLGREKIFQVRAIYNDVMFIDEFFTEDFCREQLFFSYGWNKRSTQWELQSRQYLEIKNKLLNMLTNFGQPAILVEEGNYENRGELLLLHRHDGTDLRVDWARDTLLNLYKIWRRPVNIKTVVEDAGKILRFDGKEHSESTYDVA
ncbi:MAG: SpoVR family protein [Deltaproteobacteria bacterium]|nr:SpoVR family protein [Deltaproteobacteria bacterium]